MIHIYFKSMKKDINILIGICLRENQTQFNEKYMKFDNYGSY